MTFVQATGDRAAPGLTRGLWSRSRRGHVAPESPARGPGPRSASVNLDLPLSRHVISCLHCSLPFEYCDPYRSGVRSLRRNAAPSTWSRPLALRALQHLQAGLERAPHRFERSAAPHSPTQALETRLERGADRRTQPRMARSCHAVPIRQGEPQ